MPSFGDTAPSEKVDCLGVEVRDEDRVVLVGVEREVVIAHPGHEREATELKLSLKVRADFDDVACGKIFSWEDQARRHLRAGDRVGLAPVSHDVEVVGRVAHAECDQCAVIRITQPLLALCRSTVTDLLVIDRPVTQRWERRAEPEGHALAVDHLRRVVDLAVQTPRQLVETATDQRVIEGDPPAGLRVDGIRIDGVIREEAQIGQATVREPLRLHARVVHFRCCPPHVAGRGSKDELGQNLRDVHVLRIGRRAGVVGRLYGALVVNLAPVVDAQEERPLEPLAARGQRQVATDVIGAPVPGRLGADVEPLAAEVVPRDPW